jgi:hypothetical protein
MRCVERALARHGTRTRPFAWVVIALALAGCSGLRPYPNAYAKNAVIRLTTDPGSLLSRRAVDLDLYTIDARCEADYVGTLKLRDASLDVGLPVEQKVLLAYVFSRSALIGNEGTSTIEIMLTPQRGHRYEFDVAYLKKGYTATGLDFAPGRAQGAYIEHIHWRDCKPAVGTASH